MAKMMQWNNSYINMATGYANIQYTVHKYTSPASICKSFNGFRANSKISLTSTQKLTFNVGKRAAVVPSQKAALLNTIICCDQSTASSSTTERVQEIIAQQLSVDVTTVQPHTRFSDLGADSLDTVEIVMSIEEEFGVTIPEESAENISTVQEVADLIEQQITVTL